MLPPNATKPASAIAGDGSLISDPAVHRITSENTTNAAAQQEAMRTTLLAQLRISRAELDLLRNELDLIGSALRNRLVTPHQAMHMAYDRDVLDWLFRDRECES